MKPGDKALLGWKAIAAFFGRDERTVKRWELARALPVRRVPGKRGSVWADPAELRRWLSGEPGDAAAVSGPGGWRRALTDWRLVIAVCAVVAGLGLAAVLPRPSPVRQPPAQPYAGDAAAQALYSQAGFGFESRTPAGLAQAIADLTLLTRRRPDRAEGFARLADCYLLLREFGSMPEAEAYDRAEGWALRALALDPSSPAALRALGFVRFWGRGDPAALAFFQRAEVGDPNSPQTHLWYANALLARGLDHQAIEQLARAQVLDPRSVDIAADYALALGLSGDRVSAARLLDRAQAAYPQSISVQSTKALLALEGLDSQGFLAASQRAAMLRGDHERLATLETAGRALARGGSPAMMGSLADSEARNCERGRGVPTRVAVYWAAAGNDVQARRWLAIARARHDPTLVMAPGDPLLAKFVSPGA